MSEGTETNLLFTYGTLRFAEVQLDTFGRVLRGDADALPGYTVDYVDASDGRREAAGPSLRAVLRRTGNPMDKVVGTVIELPPAELDAADDAEADRHRRGRVTLASGRTAWAYLG